MKSNLALKNPAVRRWLPWALYAAAAAVAIPLAWSAAGVGAAPAVVEVRRISLNSPRTKHRLRVAEVLVAPGQAVTAGQVLARMDPAEVDAEITVARLKLKQLEAKARNDLAQVSSRLSTDSDRSALDLTRIVADNARDKAELSQLDEEISQEQKLVTEKLANFERLNALKVRRAALAKKVEEYRHAIAQAQRGAGGSAKRLVEWRQAALKNGGASSDAALEEAARVSAEAQQAVVAELEILRARLELKSPIAGRVDEVLLHPGDTAAKLDEPVLTVVDDHPLQAVAYVDQRWATRVQVGDRVRLVPRDRSGPSLHGKVASIAPRISEMPVRFRIIPAQRRYGRTVYVQLDAPASLPGQAFDALFSHAGGGK